MVRVNDQSEVQWRECLTVATLLREMHYTFPRLVVSVNGSIVNPEEYETYVIPDEADVQVIHLMAGG